jgi:hypothetical protein
MEMNAGEMTRHLLSDQKKTEFSMFIQTFSGQRPFLASNVISVANIISESSTCLIIIRRR